MTQQSRLLSDNDAQKGAVEGDRFDDEVQHHNWNAPALGEDGWPSDPVAVAEDVLGANTDDTEISQANEIGHSSETLRDEEQDLE